MSQDQHANLVQTAMQMFGDHAGLSGLLSNAESQRLGHIVQSWVGTGSNQAIAPQQVSGVVGQDRLNELASRAGVSPRIASVALSSILPALVDKLTPNGHLPKAA